MSKLTSEFIVAAPGKVILFGEHSAVYSKPVVAASIDLKTYLLVSDHSSGTGIDAEHLVLDFPDISFRGKWKVADLPWSNVHNDSKSIDAPATDLDPDLVAALEPALASVATAFQRAAAFAFLYLYMSLCTPETPFRTFAVKSVVPVGAGLGSSASFSVILSTALLALDGHISLDQAKSRKFQNLINSWAFLGEKCLHGNPSGVDNTVATLGGAVLFQRPSTIEPFEAFPTLRLVLTDTRIPRHTAQLVSGVGDLNTELPVVVGGILDSMEHIAVEAHKTFLEMASSTDTTSQLYRLIQKLASINHGLLNAIGVGHPKLEQVVQLASSIGTTKLTGAGGGGCAITFVNEESDELAIAEYQKEAEAHGFEAYSTTLGGHGVGIAFIEKELTVTDFVKMSQSEFDGVSKWNYFDSL